MDQSRTSRVATDPHGWALLPSPRPLGRIPGPWRIGLGFPGALRALGGPVSTLHTRASYAQQESRGRLKPQGG